MSSLHDEQTNQRELKPMKKVKSSKHRTRNMVRVGILTAISVLLMYIDFPIPFVAPNFMTIDISDVPSLIAGYAMGPLSGVLVTLLKNLLILVVKGTKTGFVGELSNFIVGSTFVLISSLIYRQHKTYKTAVVSLIFGVLGMTAVASLSNYFVVYPLYAKVMIPMEAIIEMGQAITDKVVDLKSMILFTVVPFNLIKGSLNALVTMFLYKPISPILKDE